MLALTVLIGAILPAEYGIDLLGVGKATGLLLLASTPETSDAEGGVSIAGQNEGTQAGKVNITIPAGEGLEYKFYMEKGKTIRYEWFTDEGDIYFDFHGEPEGDISGYFESYVVSSAEKVRGSLTASFNGSHGWYWENDSYTPLVVTLSTVGEYSVIGPK